MKVLHKLRGTWRRERIHAGIEPRFKAVVMVLMGGVNVQEKLEKL